MRELSEMERDMLAEVGNIGAGHASNALSQLVGVAVSMSVPSVSLVPFSKFWNEVGEEKDLLTGIYIPVKQDLTGGVLLALPHQSALHLAEAMMGEEGLERGRLSEMGKSSLKEIGNILVGHCLTALSTFLGLSIEEQVPEMAIDNAKTLWETLNTSFSNKMEQVLNINVSLTLEEEESFTVHFLLTMNSEDAEKIIEAVRKKVGE